jgi:hypothetical protein
MSVRPALVTVRRPSDSVVAAKPSPKPEPIPDPDDDDMVARDARPAPPAGRGHLPPKLPSQPAALEEFPLPRARERSISKSLRIPVSVLDQLEAVCQERNLEFSTLVLHYITAGLRRPFAHESSDL